MGVVSRIVGIFGILSCLLPAQQPAPNRRALVIGNGTYVNLPKVTGSQKNAELIKETLESLSFKVDYKKDLDQRNLRDEILAFTKTINAGEIVFFYYSGYGTDLEGDNYLLPVSYDPKDTRAPTVRAFVVRTLLDALDQRQAGQRIIVLDSAWECPGVIENGQALGVMQAPDRTLVAYNTAANSVVKPPTGNSPSRFTAALAAALKKPGVLMTDVFNDAQTSGVQPGDTQRPYITQAAVNNFYFIAPKETTRVVMMDKPVSAGDTKAGPKDQLTYIWIPEGTFEMGCVAADPKCKPDEKPAHPVKISKGFWLTNSEVTLFAYKQKFLAANPSHKPPPETRTQYGGRATGLPATRVTWQDAQDYCQWVGGRLPTEAEWEYAARAGSPGKIYPWGNDMDDKRVNYYRVNNPLKKTFYESTPVMSYSETGWHLFDMAGNVGEWVADFYNPRAYESLKGTATDPEDKTAAKERVVRGGSWYGPSSDLRSSARDHMEATKENASTGFRCAITNWP